MPPPSWQAGGPTLRGVLLPAAFLMTVEEVRGRWHFSRLLFWYVNVILEDNNNMIEQYK